MLFVDGLGQKVPIHHTGGEKDKLLDVIPGTVKGILQRAKAMIKGAIRILVGMTAVMRYGANGRDNRTPRRLSSRTRNFLKGPTGPRFSFSPRTQQDLD